MKIAYFLDTSVGLGGAGNVLLEQARLMSRIHDVVVIIPCDRAGQINPEYMRRCKLARIRYTGIAYSTAHELQYIDLIYAWEIMDEIKRMALREKVDFFHSVQLNPAVEFVSRDLGIPHLMNVYQVRQEEFMFARMDIFPQYHSCDSHLYCQIWGRNLGIETRCIRPSAPLEDIRRKNRERSGTLRILMLGGVWRHKNQMLAIRAVELCNQMGINLTLKIAGDDTSQYAVVCKEYVKKNNLEKFVDIIGFQSDVVPLLEESDCYLCTSMNKSFPSSIVESMTYDLTIISTPVAGVPELLKDGVNAYVSKGYDVQDIVACILKCSSAYKNGQIEKVHKRAAALWKENFSQGIVRRQLEKYYRYIANDFQKNIKTVRGNQVSEKDVKKVYQRLYDKTDADSFTCSRCYYYACLENILKPGRAYIWGAGDFGRRAKKILETCFPWIDILAYIDAKKQGEYQGKQIISPESAKLRSVDYIFISFVEGKEEVIFFLEENGLHYNRQICILP